MEQELNWSDHLIKFRKVYRHLIRSLLLFANELNVQVLESAISSLLILQS